MNKMKNTFFILCSLFVLFFSVINANAIDVNSLTVKQENNQLSVVGVYKVNSSDITQKQQEEYMATRYNKYITVITFITAIATITMLGIFIMHIIKFAGTGTEHWIVRRNAMFGLLWSGIATALLGSATLIMGIAYNVFSW